MNNTFAQAIHEIDTSTATIASSNQNQSFISSYYQINVYYMYIIDSSIEALEHLLLVALVYILVCLSVYHALFRRLANGMNLVNSVRFPQCQRVLIVTAHPDDECMFFGPTILSLLKRPTCRVYLLCLSNGI